MRIYLAAGRPMAGAALKRLEAFLHTCGLDYDPAVSFTANLMEDGEIIATASLDGSTLKCIAVSPAHQGEDLTETGKEKAASDYIAGMGISGGYILGGTAVLPEKTVNKVFG